MPDDADTTEDTTTEAPSQTVVREAPKEVVGPLFPSGMSAPEAAMAGATATLTDKEKEKIEEMRTEYGFEGRRDAEDDD
jgi:hypothetical protein